MANGPDLLKTTQVQVEEEAKEPANRVSEVNMKGYLIKQDAIDACINFLQSRRPLNKSEHPDLDKQEFTSLVKFLSPIVSPNEAIYLSYSSKLKAKQHLEWLKTE